MNLAIFDARMPARSHFHQAQPEMLSAVTDLSDKIRLGEACKHPSRQCLIYLRDADFPLLIAVSRASRSLRDEAPRKCSVFIGAGREFSFRDSPYTLCEAVIGMIRRSISMLLRARSCHSIKSALCRHQRTVRYP
jgi:hypothetical protein